ncbi:MAG: penicillin-binding protein 2 [Bifidobacteriaceae bacterium]|jgi:cell division protein FtsI (penicillin-binding protein 3)|nr:penicillin-binding protein 2 [Bifidobacteriaceae bacterium]
MHEVKSTNRTREQVIVVLFAMLAIVIVAVLTYYQIFAAPQLKDEASKYYKTSETEILPLRGMITDRNDQVFALSRRQYQVGGSPDYIQQFVPIDCDGKNDSVCNFVWKKDADGKNVKANVDALAAVGIAKILAPVLKMDEMELAAKLNGDTPYVTIEQKVDADLAQKIRDLNIGGYIQLNEIADSNSHKRVYPNGNTAGPIVGSVGYAENGIDVTGTAGIEQLMNEELTGTSGKMTKMQAGDGTKIPSDYNTNIPAQDGLNIKTTLDMDVQRYTQQILDTEKKTGYADWGIAVVEEVKTGAIIALAETDAAKAGTAEVAKEPSKAISYVFDPGSTMKPLTFTKLLEKKQIVPDSEFYVSDSIVMDGEKFKDSTEHGTLRLTATGILARSSNVGTLLASENLNLDERYANLVRFGFGSRTGIGFNAEPSGLLPCASMVYDDDGKCTQIWDGRTKNTILFGQGISVSALQITNAYATIANGGMSVSPYIIAGTTDSTGTFTKTEHKKSKQVVDKEVTKTLTQMLISVVKGGWVVGVDVPGYQVAGKTGTSENAGKNGKLDNILTSFIGFFPADHPKYVVSLFMMNDSHTYNSAAPNVSKIMNFLVSHETILPSDAKTADYRLDW